MKLPKTNILSAAVVGLTLVSSVMTIPVNAQSQTQKYPAKTIYTAENIENQQYRNDREKLGGYHREYDHRDDHREYDHRDDHRKYDHRDDHRPRDKNTNIDILGIEIKIF